MKADEYDEALKQYFNTRGEYAKRLAAAEAARKRYEAAAGRLGRIEDSLYRTAVSGPAPR